MNRIVCVTSILLFSFHAKSQKEIARLDYLMLEDVSNTSISDLNFMVKHDFQLSSKALTLYLEYLKRDFDFFDVKALRSLEEVERLHELEFGVDLKMELGSSYKVNFLFNPTLSTTWGNPLSNEDLLWNFSASVSKSWRKNGQHIKTLRVGVLRNALFGNPKIVPTLAYQMVWDQHLFLELGFPYSSIAFTVNERNKIALNQTFIGNYTNISSSLIFEDFVEVESAKLVQNGLQLGINYAYRLQPNFTTTTQIGYQIINEFELQDASENLLYDFGSDSSIYFSLGIQYNFK